jgi:hypothetical protein
VLIAQQFQSMTPDQQIAFISESIQNPTATQFGDRSIQQLLTNELRQAI